MAEEKDKSEDKPKAVQGSDGVHGKHHSFDAGTSRPKGYSGSHRKNDDENGDNGKVVSIKKKK